jgi:AraC family transcriptional regulator
VKNTEHAEHRGESVNAQRSAYGRRIQRVIDYISANLDGDLSVATLAEVASFSPFHFHRQFSALAGVGVARLVRMLRLRRAALRLAFNPERSITEIALESGFTSSDSFGRAFRKLHGQTPSEFRSFPRWAQYEIVPALIGHQESVMNRNVEIVEFPRTRVAAVEYQGAPEQEYSAVMKLVAWRRENGVRPDQGKTIGIHYSDPASTKPEDYRLDVCVTFDGAIAPNSHGVIAKEIPGGRCARIRHHGSREYIPEAEYIYREWLPQSGERLRDFPPFFHYVNVGPDVKDEDMITDVYMPILAGS